VILGHGWASRGYNGPTSSRARAASNGGIPRRVRAAYLNDGQVLELAG
jgi:hypothetical protein